MDDTTFAAARAALATARRESRAIDFWPLERVPLELPEAYRLQSAVTRDLGAIGGWKVAAVTEAQRDSLGVAQPIGAPLLRQWMHDTRRNAVDLRVADFIAPKLECEFAFELSKDLPPRPEPYSRSEVQAAVLALRIGVEIVDSRLPRGLGALAELGDGFNNGAYIAGPRVHAWHDLELGRHLIFLSRGGSDGASEKVADGSGSAILDGDPFGTVVMLANAPPDITRGLLAGDIVTTGSCTGAPSLPGAGSYVADFGALGKVEFRFVA